MFLPGPDQDISSHHSPPVQWNSSTSIGVVQGAAQLAPLALQTASKHCWFGCRCGARAGRKLPSLAGMGCDPTPVDYLQSPLTHGNNSDLLSRNVSQPRTDLI